MKTLPFFTLFLSCIAIFAEQAIAQSSYSLKSPDGRIEIRIRTAGQAGYDVILKGRAVLENSTLSLDVEHKTLGLQGKVTDAKTGSQDQVVEPVVHQKFAKIHDHYNELKLSMEGGYAVVFRAYNEGAAYRFETSLPQEKVKIYGEESGFNFAGNDIVYYPQEDSFYSHNERKYLPVHLSEIAATSLATLPAVVDVGDGPAPTLDQLAEHVRQHLARYKVPRELVLAPVRRAANGKLDYKDVRAAALRALNIPA